MFALLTRLLVVPVSLATATPTVLPLTALSDGAATVAAQAKRDSMTVTIAPAKRVEVKLVMKKGENATFEWVTNGAEVGYNLHGEVPTDPSVKAHIYKRGSSKGEKGTIEAVFDGVHGWSWRNNGEQPVTVTVKASGQFSALKAM
ncbi:hypothetical protein [Gemmatimonas sp. UBA7669]|jgi:hypothetical protein|uniref:hypothetical protein n=1 Tax=Gemmatimonas sp. UBA7669 TaxID=1946568 RepID=UPI0025C3B7BA|nr:hypothetical protein [Gemmatimonas sp. UBA7669]